METLTPEEETLLKRLRHLPKDRQREVFDFAEFLAEKVPESQPEPSLRGIWADQGDITEEDIAEVRREMWKDFGREQFT